MKYKVRFSEEEIKEVELVFEECLNKLKEGYYVDNIEHEVMFRWHHKTSNLNIHVAVLTHDEGGEQPKHRYETGD